MNSCVSEGQIVIIDYMNPPRPIRGHGWSSIQGIVFRTLQPRTAHANYIHPLYKSTAEESIGAAKREISGRAATAGGVP